MGKNIALAVLILAVCRATVQEGINFQLPELKNESFSISYENPINVTVGEYFSIPVPQFDAKISQNDYSVYELTQEKFITLF